MISASFLLIMAMTVDIYGELVMCVKAFERLIRKSEWTYYMIFVTLICITGLHGLKVFLKQSLKLILKYGSFPFFETHFHHSHSN